MGSCGAKLWLKVQNSANRWGNFCHRAPPIDCFRNFLISFFKPPGWVPLGQGWDQNSIITAGVLRSEPGKEILAIYLAICSKNGYMSILATHKYNIIDIYKIEAKKVRPCQTTATVLKLGGWNFDTDPAIYGRLHRRKFFEIGLRVPELGSNFGQILNKIAITP